MKTTLGLKRSLLTVNEAGRSERADPSACGTHPLTLSQSSTTSDHCLLPAIDTLKFFLATAPSTFPAATLRQPRLDDDAVFNRLLLPTGDTVSCVFWNGLYHITGTDVVRALSFRFRAIGRPIQHMRKFEEGVFSDLRNLKSGIDAVLEDSKSPFLELLFRHDCVRTQKKQKVFFWFSVPHDRLFLDALDRDLRREQTGQVPSSRAVDEPALSFRWDPKRTLYDQFAASALPYAPLTSSPPLGVSAGPVVERSLPCRPITPPVTTSVQPCLPRESVTTTPASCPSSYRLCHQASSRAAIVGSLPIFRGSPSYKVRPGPAGVSHLQIGEDSVKPEMQGCKRRKTEHVVGGDFIVPPAALSVDDIVPPAECSSVANAIRASAPPSSSARATPASQRVVPPNAPFSSKQHKLFYNLG
ncbi:hypothetical protein JCM1840_004483 [Sporobolomyces johnsonii]